MFGRMELGGRVGCGQCGQAAVEWVALLALVGLLFGAMVAFGVGLPGTALVRAVGSRILCAAAFADSCGDEPTLIAAYGTRVGKLAREHMPSIAFEGGSRALPVNFRRCRSTRCGDGADHGAVRRSDRGLPVAAFVHVVDCRAGSPAPAAAGEDCSGNRSGNLYLQYWTYYADSATLRGVPIAGKAGYHHDDWEGVQLRIAPDGSVAERASSHRGYDYGGGAANWGSDAGIGALNAVAELLGKRPHGGWGPETHWLYVSGGSHAGHVAGAPLFRNRFTPGRSVHLIPLEPIAGDPGRVRFAISPPWRKQVWRDPEADGTN